METSKTLRKLDHTMPNVRFKRKQLNTDFYC